MPASDLDEARALARSAAAVIETVGNELAELGERDASLGDHDAGRRNRLHAEELVRAIERLRAI